MTTRTTNGRGESDRKGYAVATGRPQRLGKVAVAFFSIVRGGRAGAAKKLCQTAAEAACYSEGHSVQRLATRTRRRKEQTPQTETVAAL